MKVAYNIGFRIILPLFLGGIIYLIWGVENIRLVDYLLHWDFLYQIRISLQAVHLPNWVIYNLPDGLWLFALLQTLALVWNGEKDKIMWMIVGTAMAIVHEVGQWADTFQGTFDFLDLMVYGISTIASILVSNFIDQEN